MAKPSTKFRRIATIEDEPYPVRIERQCKFVPEETPPEGWRSGHTVFDGPNEDVLRLWTNAPKNESPYKHDVKWIRERRVVQQRFVSEWEDTGYTFQDYLDGTGK